MKGRIEKEEIAIKTLEALTRETVEVEAALEYDMRFEGVDLVIDHTLRAIPPPPPPKPRDVQPDDPICFAPRQLVALTERLGAASGGGAVVLGSSFVELIERVVAAGGGMLPSRWCELGRRKLQEVTRMFGGDVTGVVRWRQIVLSFLRLGLPASLSAGVSLDALQAMKLAFDSVSGDQQTVTKEQFDEVELWFEAEQNDFTPPREMVWIGWKTDYEDGLNYRHLLLDLCAAVTSEEGVRNAFALVCEDPKSVSAHEVVEVFSDRNAMTREKRVALQLYKTAEDKHTLEEILACFSAKDTTGSTPFALAQYNQAVVLDVYRLVDIDQILS